MTNRFQARLRGATTFAAIAAGLALAACNPSGSVDRSQSTQTAALPALPATLPLAPGTGTAPAYAPAAALLPAARPIRTVRVADPRDSYAYAEDAWDFADALGDAPPDYGFDYNDAQPWAWQGYDDSIAFVEPLDDGYRYYYYRPGTDTPYFVRDPDYGYGYDNGRLAAVYGPGGALVPYADYGPRLDYASRYYARGRNLYQASRQRRPVIAANWAARRDAIVDTQRWAEARASQRAWQDYHQRTEGQQVQHWREEQARRRADAVRFAAWQGQDFRTPPPPRAIPAAWTRAKWAQDQRRFAPPAAGFNGDAAARERAAMQERERVARDARERDRQAPGALAVGPAMQRLQPQPQDQQRADFARQQAERAQQARALGDQSQAVLQHQQQEQALRRQQQAQASQQAAIQGARARARQQADRAAGEQARAGQQAAARDEQLRARQQDGRVAGEQQRQAEASQRAQAERQQQRQARQGHEQARQRQALEAQRTQGQLQARAHEQAAQAQRQAAQAQQRQAVQAEQRQAVQAEQRARVQAQSQQRAQIQAQAQQRQAAQAQQRAEVQAHQRQVPPPQARAPSPPEAHAPRGNPGNGGGHKREPH